jgi:hypothetical protein
VGEVDKGGTVILFGAGRLGRRVLAECRQRNLHVNCFSDNNPNLWGQTVDGLPVVVPADMPQGYPVVVTIYNGAPVRRQVRALGHVAVGCPSFLLKHGIKLPDFGIEPPSYYLDRDVTDQSASLMPLLSDQRSRDELRQQLIWRTGGMIDDTILPPHDPPEEIYFPPFLRSQISEVYFDCGAYTGDTVKQYVDRLQDCHMIVAFEPVQQVIAEPWVKIMRTGVGRKFQYTVFTDEGPGSHAGDGDVAGTIMPLDWFYEFRPTLIKMDIEGSELEAIYGAEATIRHLKPAMAVCLYHKADHLWEVPLLLHRFNPGYRLFIRRYADDAAELVCYAIPPERCNL